MKFKVKGKIHFFDGGILEMLATLFIGLKMTNNLDWSWWWVLFPLWGQMATIAILKALAGFIDLVNFLLRAKMLEVEADCEKQEQSDD